MSEEQKKLYEQHIRALDLEFRYPKDAIYLYEITDAFVAADASPDESPYETVKRRVKPSPPSKKDTISDDAVRKALERVMEELREHRRTRAKQVFGDEKYLDMSPKEFAEHLATRIVRGKKPGEE